MKIVSLTINNIASIEGPYTLDFNEEPLKSAGIFAITGATGSGKSTILDAICLALYDKTPRLANASTKISMDDIQVSDARNLLRKGAANGMVKVVFSAIDNQLYEVQWTVRRAYNKVSGSLQNVNIKLFNLTKNQPFPDRRKSIVKEEIERLIGLNFEQFTKSVILAQGEFTSFLKADDASRATILEKLTGTEIYRQISVEVFEKQSILKNELNEITQIIAQYPLLTEEELTLINNNKEVFNAKKKKLLNQQETFVKQLDWYAKKKQLKAVLQQTKFAFVEITEKLKKHEQRKNALLQLQHVQGIKQTVLKKQHDEQNLSKLVHKQNEIEKQIVLLKQDIQLQRSSLDKINASITTHKEWTKKIQPEIDKARMLDAEIQNALKLYNELQVEHNNIQQKNLSTKKELTFKKQTLTDLNQNISLLEKWQKENAIYAQFKEKEVWINSKIAELKSIENESRDIHKKKTENTRLLEENKKHFLASTKERDKLSQKHLELQKNIQQHQLMLAQIGEDKTLIEQENIRKKQEIVRNDFTLYQAYQSAVKAQQEIEKIIDQRKLDINSKTEELTQKTQLTQQLQTEVNTLQNTLEQVKHIYDKNLIELRNMLRKDEPCMVCGSTQHPYIEHTLQQIPDEIETRFKAKKAEWQQLVEQTAGLQSTIDYLISQNKTDQIKLISHSEKVTNAKKLWEKCASFSAVSNGSNTEEWFENTFLKLENAWKENHHKSEKAANLNAKIQALNKELHNLSDSLNKLDYQLSDCRNKNEIHQFTNQSILEKTKELDSKKQKIEQELKELLVSEFWWEKYTSDEFIFKQEFNSSIKNWEESLQKQIDFDNQKQDLSSKIQALRQQIMFEDEQITKLKERLKKGKDYKEVLSKERSPLLDGKSVSATEQLILTKSESLSEQKELYTQKVNRTSIALASLQTQFSENQQNINLLQKSIELNSQEISKWIEYQDDNNKISEQKLLELSQYTFEYIQKEESFFRELEQRQIKISTLLDEHQNNLSKHLETNTPALIEEEIQDNCKKTEESLKEVIQQCQEIDFQLKKHSENEIKQQKLLHKHQKMYQSFLQWSELNDLIGSRDGKKFKIIAQEYTLDILLQYANQHLQKINQRYTLQRIDNSLSISITDHDMAGEIRSINSLSGGESFLVSLALALALSSLSSSRLNVESLFIDEGFGSLDAETLAVALDALEGLYHQGKKVGVISHVAEMAERIPVKIHLEKQGNGKSTIDIRWD